MPQGTSQTIGAVERAADVLALFVASDGQDLGVTEIANSLDLSKAVVHRLLSTLTAKELLTNDTTSRRYRLGPMALALGVAYSDKLDLRRVVRPHLRELSQRSGETATLSLRHGWTRLYIDQVTPPREVKMTVAIGQTFPLHAGGSSKAFLAFFPEEERERYLREHALEPLTEQTVTDPQRLREELATVREQGCAISLGERQAGAGSVAAPVLDSAGNPLAVLSICGPVERFRDEIDESRALLLEATERIRWEISGTR